MNVIHILNIADWALMAAGVAVALVMMVVGAGEPSSERTAEEPPQPRRRGPR